MTKIDNQIQTTKQIDFSAEQVALIKSLIAKDCNNDELNLFLYQCKRTGLDPLTRQIYCIKRAGRMTIQTSIDGFRVIAERSGSYAGQDEPIWEDDEKGIPVKCTVKVYRFALSGERYCAGVGVAYFKEYYPSPQLLQKTMPHMMIAKVAEALALRKAYPQDLSGLYTGDEISEGESITPEPKPQEQPQNKPQGVFGPTVEGDVSNIYVLHEKIKLVSEATKSKELGEWVKIQPQWVKENAEFYMAVRAKLESLNQPTPASKGEDSRPWLSDEQYKDALHLINNGEDLIDDLTTKYRMKKVYREGLGQATEFTRKLAGK